MDATLCSVQGVSSSLPCRASCSPRRPPQVAARARERHLQRLESNLATERQARQDLVHQVAREQRQNREVRTAREDGARISRLLWIRYISFLTIPKRALEYS